VLPQNQGATSVNLENIPEKCTKLNPIQASELSNLPNNLPPQPSPEIGGKVKVVKGEGEGKEVKDFELCQPCYLNSYFLLTIFSGDFANLMTVSNNIKTCSASHLYQ
jgi:hypothetical protein